MKSRFLANFIEKKESIFDSKFENSLLKMLLCVLGKGGKWRERLEALILFGFPLHFPQRLGCKDIIHQPSSPDNSLIVITWRYCVTVFEVS